MGEHHLTDEERRAGHKPHRCTDILCTLIFVASMCGLSYVHVYAHENGDIRKLLHGVNFEGDVCGVDAKVIDKPLLFWCPLSSSSQAQDVLALAGDADADALNAAAVYQSLAHLDTRHPICVSSCPTSKDSASCYEGATIERSEAEDAAGSYTETRRYNFKFVQAYDSEPVGGERYCMPQTLSMLSEIKTDESLFSMSGAMKAIGEVYTSWKVVAGSAVLAIVIGYLYLFLMQHLMAPIIYLTILFSALMPLIAGLAVLYGAYKEEADKLILEQGGDLAGVDIDVDIPEVPSTGDSFVDMSIGGGLALIGVGVVMFACCCRHSIQLVIGTLEASCECLRDLPTALLQPAFSILSKGLVLCSMGYGCALMATCGEVEPYDVNSGVPTGLTRTFVWTDTEKKYLAFYVFMTLWVLETLHALDQFVIAYAAQLWFFKEYVTVAGISRKPMTCLPMVRGLFIGVIFHFGTLAFGAFLLALLKAIYFILSILMRQVEQASADEDGKPNCFVRVILGCCCCCMTFWDQVIRFMNGKVYILTAIESLSFCSAAKTAIEIVASEVAAIGALEVATYVVSIGGVLTITGLGGFATWEALHQLDIFRTRTSEYFVEDPMAVTAAASIVCFFIAVSFMVVFDTITDTIIFCWALDRKRQSEAGMFSARGRNYIPTRLKGLMAETGDNNSDHSDGTRSGLLK